MTIIGTLQYRDGKLVPPHAREIYAAKSAMDFSSAEPRPTAAMDHSHIHRITTHGRTPNEVRQRAQVKMDNFYTLMGGVYGFSTLETKVISGSNGGNHTITYEIIYVVESRSTRPAVTHGMDSRYAGFQRNAPEERSQQLSTVL